MRPAIFALITFITATGFANGASQPRNPRVRAQISVIAEAAQPIHAVLNGTVVSDSFTFHQSSKGIKVKHGSKVFTYGGFDGNTLNLKVGDQVKAGDQLGLSLPGSLVMIQEMK